MQVSFEEYAANYAGFMAVVAGMMFWTLTSVPKQISALQDHDKLGTGCWTQEIV